MKVKPKIKIEIECEYSEFIEIFEDYNKNGYVLISMLTFSDRACKLTFEKEDK
jgi:hypothetical protein